MNQFKPKSEFSRNVVTLITGTTIAQAIPIAISPILTRIYTPHDFGVFALFTAITSILSVIGTGRYELAIMLPTKDVNATNIIVLSSIIAFFISLLSFLVIFIFNTQITTILGNPEISNWLYLIPISLFITGIYQNLNYWNNRKKRYKQLADNRIIQSTTTAITNIGMGSQGLGTSGLIIGSILGQGIATVLLSKKLWDADNRLFYKIKKLKIFAMLRKYMDFPKHSLPTALLDTLSINAPLFILTQLFSTTIVGYYSFSYKLLQLPMSLIGTSVSQVFYQQFSELKGNYIEQKKLLLSVWKKQFMLGLIPFSILFFFGEEIFSFLFGNHWAVAGKIASVLSTMIFFMFISSPTSSVFTVLRIQKIGLYFGVFVLITRPLTLFVGYIFNSFWFGLELMVLIEIIQIIIYNIVILKKLKSTT